MKRELPGRRTAFTVCHAMSSAMTVFLPAPVARFSARRLSSAACLAVARLLASARCSRYSRSSLPSLGATSVSQITVSAASTWQKNGRMSANAW